MGAGVIFYLAFLLGGFAMLSWISALACAGTIALLLRRGSATGAAIAIFAVPLIAERTPPRADMFSVLLFAAFLSILWQQYRTGDAPLWLLPPIMVLWVNVHFGFAAGLGLIAAYVGAEVLEFFCGEERRRAAMQRLRKAYGWLILTVAATLVNSVGLGHLSSPALAAACEFRTANLDRGVEGRTPELADRACGVFLRRSAGRSFPDDRCGRDCRHSRFVPASTGRGRSAAGVNLSTCPSHPHGSGIRLRRRCDRRSCFVAGALASQRLDSSAAECEPLLAATAVMLLAVVVYTRCTDLVSNRFYFGATPQLSTFGSGLGWWFPERAANFIEQHNLPGEIFNTYDEGGYISWKLGPGRLDYIDGRDTLFGRERIERGRDVLQSSPDSALMAGGNEPTQHQHGHPLAYRTAFSMAVYVTYATAAHGGQFIWTKCQPCLFAARRRRSR